MNPGEDFDHFERSVISNLQLTCATSHARSGTGMWKQEISAAVKSAVEEFDGKVITQPVENVECNPNEISDGIILHQCSYGQSTIHLGVLSYWKTEWDEGIYEMSLQLMFAKLIATVADYKLVLFEIDDENHFLAMTGDFTRMLASGYQNQAETRYLFGGWHILDEEFTFYVHHNSDKMHGEYKVEEDLVIPNKWLVSLSSDTTPLAEELAESVLPWKIEASLFGSNYSEPNAKFFFEEGYSLTEVIDTRLEEFRFSKDTDEIIVLISFSNPVAVNTVFELVKLKPKSKGKIRLVGIRPDEDTNARNLKVYDELLKNLSDTFIVEKFNLNKCYSTFLLLIFFCFKTELQEF